MHDFSQHEHLRAFVERARTGRAGYVTDVDGTISPIAPTPDAAYVTDAARTSLHALSQHLALVAVISGRAADDVRQRVGVDSMTYVGNHGMEIWADGGVSAIPEAAAARPALERVIAAAQPELLPGMILEDKRVTLSIHYRSADHARAQAKFTPLLERVTAQTGLRLFPGKLIYEIRPDIPTDKGTAFVRLIHDYQLDAAIYIGDDVTDADALRAAREMRSAGDCYAVGIGVTSEDTPAVVQESADMLVEGVGGVEAMLAWLVSALSAS